MIHSPSAYSEGYAKARLHDQAAADNYIKHTTMGDSVLDPIMEELSSLSPAVLHHFIWAGIEQQDEALRKAPRILRDFFETIDQPPPWLRAIPLSGKGVTGACSAAHFGEHFVSECQAGPRGAAVDPAAGKPAPVAGTRSRQKNGPAPWLDYEAFRPGIRAFHANVDLMLVAFVTGVLVEGFSTLIAKSFRITGRVSSTKRRLQQNNRHMMDIFFPRGLQRENDGRTIFLS